MTAAPVMFTDPSALTSMPCCAVGVERRRGLAGRDVDVDDAARDVEAVSGLGRDARVRHRQAGADVQGSAGHVDAVRAGVPDRQVRHGAAAAGDADCVARGVAVAVDDERRRGVARDARAVVREDEARVDVRVGLIGSGREDDRDRPARRRDGDVRLHGDRQHVSRGEPARRRARADDDHLGVGAGERADDLHGARHRPEAARGHRGAGPTCRCRWRRCHCRSRGRRSRCSPRSRRRREQLLPVQA